MPMKTALTIAGGYLAVAQGLSMILTQTMAAFILGVATPFLVLGGCVAYVLERDTRPEVPPHQTAPRIIDVPPRRFRKAA
jgi:cytochrome c biogenesis protein CcdA